MELREYLRVLARQWAWIGGCLLVAVWLAVAYLSVTPKTYTARSELFLSAETESGGTLLDLSSYSEQRAKSYAEIVNTPAVLQPVIDDLGLNTTVPQLSQSVEASVPLETVLLSLEVTREDSAEATRIADALSDSVLALINSLEGEDADGVTATIITRAELDPAPTSPDRRMTLAAAGVLGLGAGLGMAVFRHRRDSVLRTQEDIRRTVTQAVDTAGPLRVQVSDETASRLYFVDGSAVPTYLSARDQPHLLVFVLHDGKTRTLPGALVDAATRLAGARDSVCVVDTDPEHRPLSEWAGIAPTPGWSDIVSGDATVEQASHRWLDSSLSLVPSGDSVDQSDPAGSSLALLEIRRQYACTIVMVRHDEKGSPPQALGQADVIVLWVEKGSSNRRALTAQFDLALVALTADVVVVSTVGAGSRSRGRRSR